MLNFNQNLVSSSCSSFKEKIFKYIFNLLIIKVMLLLAYLDVLSYNFTFYKAEKNLCLDSPPTTFHLNSSLGISVEWRKYHFIKWN